MTHIPGQWPEERSSRMSSRDWQGGGEATDPHAVVACRDTHESCVVTLTCTAVRTIRNRNAAIYMYAKKITTRVYYLGPRLKYLQLRMEYVITANTMLIRLRAYMYFIARHFCLMQ